MTYTLLLFAKFANPFDHNQAALFQELPKLCQLTHTVLDLMTYTRSGQPDVVQWPAEEHTSGIKHFHLTVGSSHAPSTPPPVNSAINTQVNTLGDQQQELTLYQSGHWSARDSAKHWSKQPSEAVRGGQYKGHKAKHKLLLS